jgi:phosphate starvation-inducible PhoH-like protein
MEDTGPLESSNEEYSAGTAEAKIELPERELQELFYANGDTLLHEIEKETGLYVAGRDSHLTLRGNSDALEKGKRIIGNIINLFLNKKNVQAKDLSLIIRKTQNDIHFSIEDLQSKQISIGQGGKKISPQSFGQGLYFDAIRNNDLVFAIGPAGTGKTYLAMAFALHFLMNDNISRIILTRPVVEAGESLGFLPGDLEQKVNPYLRPLYDAIYDMIPYSVFQKYAERGAIEVAPLAYMRGRTLHDSFIILDEAQNTSRGQIFMFLTRIGFNSKTIVTGDITQTDLPKSRDSGLIIASRILKGIKGISFVHLTPADVVRHPLVEKIIKAFERQEQEENNQ